MQRALIAFGLLCCFLLPATALAENIFDRSIDAPDPLGLEGYGDEFSVRDLYIYEESQPGDDFQQSLRRGINLAVLVIGFTGIIIAVYLGALAIFGSHTEDNHKKIIDGIKYLVLGTGILIASYTIVIYLFSIITIGGTYGGGDDGRSPRHPDESCIPGSLGDWYCEQRYGSNYQCGSDWQCRGEASITPIGPPPDDLDIERLACDASNAINGIFGDRLCQLTLIRPTKGGATEFCGEDFVCSHITCNADADCDVLNDPDRPPVPGQVWACDTTLSLCSAGPIADAGFDKTTDRGILVQLSASRSSDPAGGILSYLWELENSTDPSITQLTPIPGTQDDTVDFFFTAPSVVTILTVKVTVRSSESNLESTDTVEVIVQ